MASSQKTAKNLELDKASQVNITGMSDSELQKFCKEHAISLKIEEARLVAKKLGRNPTLTELYVFNTEWSEHSSYKSSRKILKLLPTKGKNVILGPSEDSGIIELGYHDGEKYGIVISHESHNHPSQVVPYEGAATGIGGDIRDVLCMGAKVIAVADPLRFGNPQANDDKIKNRTKYIANTVIDGIAGYGNPVGVPNIGGDIYFNESFDDNCLVNVVCLGLVKEKEIIHSYAPKDSEGFDIVVIGKATDNSGFGGSAFASLILDEKDAEANKGAVQVPDPFLKLMLLRSTQAVFEEVRKRGIAVGFKDMGAGGIMCATSELSSAGGYGCIIDLDKVHVSMKDLPPYIISCSETQERFTWIVPKEFTPRLLEIYNKDFELPSVAEGACASVVGTVTKERQFVMLHKGKKVCDLPVDEVTGGILYERKSQEVKTNFVEPKIPEPMSIQEYNELLLKVLSHPNVCSRRKVYEHYDTNVLGNTVIPPGYADAGLLSPIRGSPLGVALSVDHNPKYSRIDPYWGAAAAVAESMRNVAAVGAVPAGLTDCLNFGNPEVPEVFWQFTRSVEGIRDAAEKICYKKEYDKKNIQAVPIVSGNVSFYNENAKGKSVDPSPIICCVGTMDDYTKRITMSLKKEGSKIILIGKRKDELGGSVYYDLHSHVGANVPRIDFEYERKMIYAIIESIEAGMLLACHDISDGGLVTSISEMAILGGIGAEIDVSSLVKESSLSATKIMLSETSGFVVEVDEKNVLKFEEHMKKSGVDYSCIGKTTKKSGNFDISNNKMKIISLSVEKMKENWEGALSEVLE